MLSFLVFCIVLLATTGSLHWYWNRQRDLRDEKDRASGITHTAIENEEFLDMTDFQLRSFRYPV